MRIVSLERLAEAGRRHADAAGALEAWATVVRKVVWRNPAEVRKTYATADGVKIAGGRTATVFNIRGNNYRLIAAIDYPLGVVNVLTFLTHAEYDKEKWKGI